MVLIFPFETCLLFGCSFPLRFLRWGLLSLLFVSLPCFVCHFLYACSALLHLLVAFLVVFLGLIGFSSALFPWYFSLSCFLICGLTCTTQQVQHIRDIKEFMLAA